MPSSATSQACAGFEQRILPPSQVSANLLFFFYFFYSLLLPKEDPEETLDRRDLQTLYSPFSTHVKQSNICSSHNNEII